MTCVCILSHDAACKAYNCLNSMFCHTRKLCILYPQDSMLCSIPVDIHGILIILHASQQHFVYDQAGFSPRELHQSR